MTTMEELPRALAIRNARVVPITGDVIENGTVVISEGVIEQILDSSKEIPKGYHELDASGKWILPGFIDAHTHVGIHEEANGWAGNDTNEMTDPNTAHVRAIDAVNPSDIAFREAIEGGVLIVNVNPGSGNPIGGQAVTLRCFGSVIDEMVMKSPSGMKSALGENPKRVYGDKKQMPSTRLGTAAVIRSALVQAQNYMKKLDNQADGEGFVERDLKLEALAKVLSREIPWRQHSHRADDIMTALRIAEEFGYDLVIDHGTEAHLVADRLAAKDIPVIIGPLFTARSKVELLNRSLKNPARLVEKGVRISITTDHPVVPIHFLIYQAALAVKEGLDQETALASVTINPARILGIDDRVGSLEVGKDADLCVWSGNPLDFMSRVELAFSKGRHIYSYDYQTSQGVFVEP
ncbi:Imidazolonepropionase [Ferrithrix thermotolerans DSM 19514]|uniref:Imidazolonepropionase n=2 Tax=Ferrithrix TaxID=643949 RepID=A0A1M4U8L3_9ACTN|nr:Imidazolonepropionase [Ferrithrix thermotolerans DSM 19514]